MTSALDHALDRSSGGGRSPRWHALWTRNLWERPVGEQLRSLGFQVYLPEMRVWSWRGGVRRATARPLFPGHLLLRHAMDRESCLRALAIRGVVRLLGERWDRLSVVPDGDVEAVRRLADGGLTPRPHPYVRDGRRVKVRRGPLAEIEGFFVETRPERGFLVRSIDVFRCSVAVEIDSDLVAPA